MLIIPAIDLRQGVCVRLSQGKFDAVTTYGDPFDRLRDFAAAGAKWAHIVDLDGAKAGAPAQYDLIGRLANASTVRIQSGGGVRTFEHVSALLGGGVARVVVGSVAVRDPAMVRDWIGQCGAEHICVALDVRRVADHWEVAADGWTIGTGVSLADALAAYPVGELRHVLVTDVSRDGMLMGPNLALMQEMQEMRPDLRVQASGGVSHLKDIGSLRAVGASGVIIGRALYEARFTLEAALAL